METILVAYGEIALKSRHVRSRLEKLLVKQVDFALGRMGLHGHRVLRRYGRFYIEGAPAQAAEAVANVFGVVSAMPSLQTKSDIDSVVDLAVKVASDRIGDGEAFAVRPKTVGAHPYSSRDLAVRVGSSVLEVLAERGIRVDLDDPDVTLYIEVRDKEAFVYTRIIDGVGGLPYGSQGRLVSLFSGGIDSPVSTWLMMKRGTEVLPIFMDQRPHVGDSYVDRVEKAYQTVGKFVPSEDFSLYLVPFGEVMSRIMESSAPSLRCVLCKRSMYRVASTFAAEMNAQGIVTGESLGQVASQTLDNLYVIDGASDLPVHRPLIGFDKVEIENIARKIGTYEVTARTVEGCTVVPDKPATWSRMDQVVELEEDLGLEEVCAEVSEKIVKKGLD